MPRLRHPLTVATLVACGCVLLAIALVPQWVAQKLAASLRQRIATADETRAAELVEHLAALDSAGLSHLIELLDDPRPAVRKATHRSMSERLEVWSEQRTTTSQRNIEQLASLLATHQGPAEFHSRAFVKLMALKLLRRSDDASDSSRTLFLANCSAILERTLSAYATEPERTRPVESTAEPAAFELSDPPAMETPYEPVAESPDTSALSDSGPALLNPGDEQPLPRAPIALHRPQRTRSSEVNLPSEQVDDDALRALPTRSLIRRLHDVPTTADLAERELRRRGFDDASLRMARALDDADPRVRQQLADALPGMTGIDPGPWLWELVEDEDENVRRTARNILATSNNPQTRARVGRLK